MEDKKGENGEEKKDGRIRINKYVRFTARIQPKIRELLEKEARRRYSRNDVRETDFKQKTFQDLVVEILEEYVKRELL